MHLLPAPAALHQNAAPALAEPAGCLALEDEVVLAPELPAFDAPVVVEEEAEVVRVVVRRGVVDGQDHQPLLAGPLTDVAVAGLALLLVGCAPEPTPVAALLRPLAVQVDAQSALWAI
jgi:hypothetical protein